MTPTILLAIVIPLLALPSKLPPDPRDARFGDVVAALTDGDWSVAKARLEAAIHTREGAIEAWMRVYDELSFRPCNAVDVARSQLELALQAESRGADEWEMAVRARDDPGHADRVGLRVSTHPKVIPGGESWRCMVAREQVYRDQIARRDRAAEAEIMGHIDRIFAGSHGPTDAVCAFTVRWAIAAHRMHLRAKSSSEPAAPTVDSEMASAAYGHLLASCPAPVADGELILYFAELKYSLRDLPAAGALLERYREIRPDEEPARKARPGAMESGE